eukprot:GHVU01173447.1.p1 GENE.GHVU01173447.1~~GHVU01173447.1.p1  ORF type:complete len:116 (-),score=12.79 GHVU01173447.1:415-762(-)
MHGIRLPACLPTYLSIFLLSVLTHSITLTHHPHLAGLHTTPHRADRGIIRMMHNRSRSQSHTHTQGRTHTHAHTHTHTHTHTRTDGRESALEQDAQEEATTDRVEANEANRSSDR